MITFIKTHGWKILTGIVAVGILYLGVSFTKDLLFGKALEAARLEYKQQVADLQAKVETGKAAYLALGEKAGQERETHRVEHEKEIRNINTVFDIFKSTSAAELKKKGAKIDEVLVEKEKDEAALFEAKETIAGLDLSNQRILANWELSDIAKDAAHKKIVDAITLKYTKCQEWSDKLDAKLKPKPLAKVLQVAEILVSFALGRLSNGKII